MIRGSWGGFSSGLVMKFGVAKENLGRTFDPLADHQRNIDSWISLSGLDQRFPLFCVHLVWWL
jgi:hypothetical protein